MINRIILIGRIGQNPETFKDGKIAKLSLATNKNKKNEKGGWEPETTWHTVVSFNNQAEKMAAYKRATGQSPATYRLPVYTNEFMHRFSQGEAEERERQQHVDTFIENFETFLEELKKWELN